MYIVDKFAKYNYKIIYLYTQSDYSLEAKISVVGNVNLKKKKINNSSRL